MQCVGPLHTVVPPTFTELRRRGLALRTNWFTAIDQSTVAT
jgi:hypothetical protein